LKCPACRLASCRLSTKVSLRPGEDPDAGETVQLDEDRAGTLVTVCAACHRMLHAADTPSAEQLRHDFQGPRCPACGERTADRIVYGLSVGAAKPGNVLGGCIFDDASPDLSCRSCGSPWIPATVISVRER